MRDHDKEYLAALCTMALVAAVTICVTIYAIFELWKH